MTVFYICLGIIAYFLLINFIGYTAFYVDKRAAQERERRISEQSLLGLALLGGTPGCMAAQRRFRHKTRKQPFKFYLQLIGVMQVLFLVALCIPSIRGRLLEAVSQLV